MKKIKPSTAFLVQWYGEASVEQIEKSSGKIFGRVSGKTLTASFSLVYGEHFGVGLDLSLSVLSVI